MRLERVAKLTDIVVGDLFGTPLVVVLGEKLNTIAARARGNLDRLEIPTGDRHVRPKYRHRIVFLAC